MKPERWKEIDNLFSAALDIEADKRAAFLDEACIGDEDLRKKVESLLASDGKDHRIESYPMEIAADLLAERPLLLSSDKTIGPYKISSLLGSGGMGDVYRAYDPRLGRDVAIKILPAHFSQDPDRLKRFEQEARAASVLNHPNILAIYDAATDNGSPYLVSELLQGEVLQQKLKGNPLPIRKAIDYSLQIAKGLSAAHEKGIVHRDLKPGNIFITKEGRAKILDFGLAKLTQPDQVPAAEKENLTETGVVLGTVVYMSPEQVSGRRVDHRSDIFAFGAVLYEMLCGKRPFGGDTQIEIMHAILKSDPPELSQTNATISPSLERIVRRCLEKDPEHRFQTTSDLAFALESFSSTSGTAVTSIGQKKSIHILWILSVVFFLGTLFLGTALYRSKDLQQTSLPVQKFSIVLPDNTVLNSLAISPDGRRIAYVINEKIGLSQLWLRSLDSTDAEFIHEGDDATLPFWSPDSRFIGFFTQNKLKKLAIGAGPPVTLCDVSVAKGGTWNQYGEILFSPTTIGGLRRISDGGGEPTQVRELDTSQGETAYRFPQFLPDGRHYLYLVGSSNPDYKGIYVGSLDSKVRKRILAGTPAPVRFIDGYLFFTRYGKLMVQQFDANRLELAGKAIAIADNESNAASGPYFSVSENNVLLYGDAGAWAGWESQPIWFDRSGKRSNPFKNLSSALGEPGIYNFCDMSADLNRLLTFYNGTMWIVDLLNGSFNRFAMTNDNIGMLNPVTAVLSPDGSQVIYVENYVDIYRRPINGTGKAELLYHAKFGITGLRWSRNSKFITFTGWDSTSSHDLWMLPVGGEHTAFPYLQTQAREDNLNLSPDGKWTAYESYESGQPEVYVRSFPLEAGGKWQISMNGGEQPMWRQDGKELFYLTLDKQLMATEVQTGEIFKPGVTKLLFQTQAEPRINTAGISSYRQYFVSSDGKHFLVNNLLDKTTGPEIRVVLNWKSLLKR
jgi:serine/threonine protein kinase